jgi:NAD(P)H-dependent FMN reductase
MKLGIIVGTTRQSRQTIKQAKWVAKTAGEMEGADVEVIDLADYPMPFFDEAISPRYNPDRKPAPEVQKFLDVMNQQDAFVFVTPEYNHSIPAVLKNAFDYLTWEMNRKPAAIVSHGTVGGARAAMHLKEILSEGKAVPIPNFVAFAHMSDGIDDDGNLSEELAKSPYGPQATLQALLDELTWYGQVLKAGRGDIVDFEAVEKADA